MNKWMSVIALAMLAGAANAAPWQVANQDSRVSFISIKKGDIAEVHHFKRLSGSLDDKGHFELNIPLSSVSTGVEIRDERMQSLLFDVTRFPQLTLNASLAPALIADLAVGDSRVVELDGQIGLHGKALNKRFSLVLAKLSEHKVQVSSWQPVIVNAKEFDLVAGVDKLRDIAGLPSISLAVPVSFVLTLTQ
ncbi:YceI family protein [Shewanella sp. AS16]|uniref:YceI family protein n=1 Tax=Shewanella sp. AS16 TaxID=2907625 RepID=UPI001F43A58A|nr:YceI family protein [Shewanella sp. AS16]MCE9687472.1 YceI family protein [Shewanella sp. AS16]